jgi:ketosteroid isomerase-like protein
MKIVLAAIVGALVGVIGGHFLWRGGNEAVDLRVCQGATSSGVSAADRAAINKLHQQDIDVTLTQDPNGLVELWAEDGVRISPDGKAVVGRTAIGADNAKFWEANPGFKVMRYAPDLEHFSTAIAGGWALETGTLSATFKMSAKDEPVSTNIKTLRLLQRQADGAWKFALVELK